MLLQRQFGVPVRCCMSDRNQSLSPEGRNRENNSSNTTNTTNSTDNVTTNTFLQVVMDVNGIAKKICHLTDGLEINHKD